MTEFLRLSIFFFDMSNASLVGNRFHFKLEMVDLNLASAFYSNQMISKLENDKCDEKQILENVFVRAIMKYMNSHELLDNLRSSK